MRRFALLGAVLLAVAVVAVVAWRTDPDTGKAAHQGGQAVTVTSVTRSCPPAAPGTGTAQISMISLPAAAPAGSAAAAPPGTATFTAISAPSAKAAATKPLTVSASGQARTVTAPGKNAAAGTAVAATGQMAEGFEAEQVDAAGTGLVSCTHPGSDMWFVGTGQGAGADQIVLYLTNTGDLTATADLTVLTDAGQQSGLSDAITVQPDQVVRKDVTPFVKGSQGIALHVQTSAGQVAAAVWEGTADGDGAWLPQAAAPATTLVIPGLTVASSAARLFVTVPGSADSRLKVTAYTPSGRVPQFTASPVEASAGATTPVTLNALGATAAGLELVSNVPIVAGVQVPGSGIGEFTAASAPLVQQGLVAGNPGTRGVTVGLLLTAPKTSVQVRVTAIGAAPSAGTASAPAAGTGAGGAGAGGKVVTVAAGHTLAVAVPRPPGSGREPFAIALAPLDGSGPLYAVRVVTSGTGGLAATVAALLPVQSALTAITLPPVDNSYTAVLP